MTIRINEDNLIEGTETLTLRIIRVEGLSRGGEVLQTFTNREGVLASFDVTINDDPPPLTVAVTAPAGSQVFEEGDTVEFSLVFNIANDITLPNAVSLDYTLISLGNGNTTIFAGRKSGSIRATIPNDNLNEPASKFTVTLTTVTGATIASGRGTAEVTIAASDPIAVTITRQGDAEVNENADVTFRVSLSGGVRTTDVIVPFSLPRYSSYYTIRFPGSSLISRTGTVTFERRNTNTAMDFTVRLHDNTLNEATRTITLTGAPAGAMGLRTVGGGPIAYATGGNTASVTLTDNDPITVTVAPAESSVSEGDEA
ncbi:MAG: hypothetical protein OXU41_08815, partial [Gammaproteobacteria bacterium]|nr:hypothetical protein [Gammaproteobacteria bacterium]